MRRFNGIAGLEGREPVGAILRVGRKHPQKGYPIDRQRFYVAKTTQDASGAKPLHPAFAPFNAPVEDPSTRATVLMGIVHATRDECSEMYLRNQRSPRGSNPPNMRPFCTGDGISASRWDGERGEFCGIACLNEACEYRQPGSGHRGQGRACKPHARLLAQILWRREVAGLDVDKSRLMPSVLCRFTSNSWNTAAAIKGFFDAWDRLALQLTRQGADLVDTAQNMETGEHEIIARKFSLVGAKFELSLQEKADKDPRTGESRRYPIVVMSPVDDPLTHLLHQATAIQQIRDSGRAAVAMLRDPDQQDQRTADYLSNEVGSHTDGSTT